MHPISTKKLFDLKLPLFTSTVAAGFPSPAESHSDTKLDLNGYLVKHPESTFLVKVEGNSMIEAGIFSGDILVVDRSIEPRNEHIVLAVLDGEFTVKRYVLSGQKAYLIPENKAFKAIEINTNSDFQIWGVVSFVIHKTN
jgi:DNA polymerase V